jgi:hypothetical protein
MEPVALIDAGVFSALLIALGLVLTTGGRTGDVSQQCAGRFLSAGGVALWMVAAGTWQHSPAGNAAAVAVLLLTLAASFPRQSHWGSETQLAEGEERP